MYYIYIYLSLLISSRPELLAQILDPTIGVDKTKGIYLFRGQRQDRLDRRLLS